jgi:nitrate reductase assembly molybdenum cofactor insertion protein NarJ
MPSRLRLKREEYEELFRRANVVEMHGDEVVAFEDRVRGRRYRVLGKGRDHVEVEES